MKPGDLIRVRKVLDGVHPVGIVTSVVQESEDDPRHMMCFYLDGDHEVLSYDTDFEVISESR
jgi:hypothetical protein